VLAKKHKVNSTTMDLVSQTVFLELSVALLQVLLVTVMLKLRRRINMMLERLNSVVRSMIL
jgi:hypothetical protein